MWHLIAYWHLYNENGGELSDLSDSTSNTTPLRFVQSDNDSALSVENILIADLAITCH